MCIAHQLERGKRKVKAINPKVVDGTCSRGEVDDYSRKFPSPEGAIISKIIFHGLVTLMVVKGLHLARPSSRPLLPLLVWWQGMPHGFRAPFNPWGACWEEREEGGTREGGVEGGGRRERERENRE